ncbi:MAG: hypothetical protein HGB10_03250 [Coriobacteriia bacterium]|nr:hypothetical protein [Coriobacteriia bacterium]
MSEQTKSRAPLVWVIALVLLGALLAGQALSAATAPPGGTASTGRVMGKTTYAYLGGIRTFAAAVLWNRLEPLYHGFYGGRNVDELGEFLPTMRLVQALDPQFEQAYYNSSFMLARRGMMDEALRVARDGLAKNPQSGLMLANLTQLLLMQDKVGNLPEMVTLAEQGASAETKWSNGDDQFEGYGIFMAAFRLAGNDTMVEALRDAQTRLGEQGAGLGVERDE